MKLIITLFSLAAFAAMFLACYHGDNGGDGE
jgi:hypothetical protein